MDFRDSSTTEPSPPSTDAQNNPSQEHVASVSEDLETTCWGCGLHLTVSPYAPAFMCSWCGAITNHKAHKIDNKNFWWRRLQDRCFVCLLFVFMLFMICGGIWAIYPVVFSISYFCGTFHCCITLILSVTTISMYCFAAFRSAGAPPIIAWGSYPVVGRGGLDNYTFCVYCSKPKSPRTHHCRSCGMCVLDMDHHCPFIMKKNQRPWRRLITISTAEGKWHGNWDRDYSFSLRDLQLEDLAEEDGDKNAQVFINLCIHKHAGFGLSVHGGICASFTRKCSNCSAPYCREIDTNFNVWVLPSSRNSSSSPQLPEIGGDDPSVIYVKPGCEADLDSLVQDTIRLTTSVNETCSDLCEKAEPRIQHLSKQNSASIDKRWSRLLELRKAYQ